jgi:hypothetical protein
MGGDELPAYLADVDLGYPGKDDTCFVSGQEGEIFGSVEEERGRRTHVADDLVYTRADALGKAAVVQRTSWRSTKTWV